MSNWWGRASHLREFDVCLVGYGFPQGLWVKIARGGGNGPVKMIPEGGRRSSWVFPLPMYAGRGVWEMSLRRSRHGCLGLFDTDGTGSRHIPPTTSRQRAVHSI